MFLLTVYAYSVAFVYLPPTASLGWKKCTTPVTEDQDKVEVVLLEKDIFPLEKKKKKTGHVFCLQTAAWLLELSWMVKLSFPY